MISVKIITALIVISKTHSYEFENINLTFPDGILIGTASSAYQVEGAWNVSDRSN